jgi:hypothetical protein
MPSLDDLARRSLTMLLDQARRVTVLRRPRCEVVAELERPLTRKERRDLRRQDEVRQEFREARQKRRSLSDKKR